MKETDHHVESPVVVAPHLGPKRTSQWKRVTNVIPSRDGSQPCYVFTDLSVVERCTLLQALNGYGSLARL